MGELVVSVSEADECSSMYAKQGAEAEAAIADSSVAFTPVHTGYSWVQEGLAISKALDGLQELSRRACYVAASQGTAAGEVVAASVETDNVSTAALSGVGSSVETVVR